MAELYVLIRAAIVQWDRSSRKGVHSDEFVYLLSERERDELARRIAAALEGRDG